jgi:hypothetical protein
MMDGNSELPAWIQDKMAVMYHSADAIKSYLSGKNMGNMNEADDEDEDDSESPTYLLNKKSILDREITRYSKSVDKFIPMVDKLNPEDIKTYFQPESEFTMEGFKDFLTKKEDESSVDYYQKLNQTGEFTYRAVFDSLVNPRKRGFLIKYGNKIGGELLEDMEDVLSDIFDMGNSIYTKNKEIQKIEDTISDRGDKGSDFDYEAINKPTISSKGELDALSIDDIDDEMLEEINLPIKGKNVDSENKSNSNKENTEATKDAEDSQETTEEKVDNLKNQKYEKNSWEENVDETLKGWRNNLDLDYKTGISKEQADKIKDQASGKAPKDHANVDHESKGGEKLINAAKMRAEDNFINKDDYTSKNDRTQIEKGQSYEKSTIFDKIDENVDKDINRLKSLFTYEEKMVNENKKHVTNEAELFFKQVSRKKFI